MPQARTQQQPEEEWVPLFNSGSGEWTPDAGGFVQPKAPWYTDDKSNVPEPYQNTIGRGIAKAYDWAMGDNPKGQLATLAHSTLEPWSARSGKGEWQVPPALDVRPLGPVAKDMLTGKGTKKFQDAVLGAVKSLKESLKKAGSGDDIEASEGAGNILSMMLPGIVAGAGRVGMAGMRGMEPPPTKGPVGSTPPPTRGDPFASAPRPPIIASGHGDPFAGIPVAPVASPKTPPAAAAPPAPSTILSMNTPKTAPSTATMAPTPWHPNPTGTPVATAPPVKKTSFKPVRGPNGRMQSGEPKIVATPWYLDSIDKGKYNETMKANAAAAEKAAKVVRNPKPLKGGGRRSP